MDQFDKDKGYVQKGSITCNRNILLSIISLATKEISGVACLMNEKSWLKRLFLKNYMHGVSVKFDQSGRVGVDVYVSVYFGYNVPDVAYKVQENIKNSISSMVDMRTTKVNVHVLGVDFNKSEMAPVA